MVIQKDMEKKVYEVFYNFYNSKDPEYFGGLISNCISLPLFEDNEHFYWSDLFNSLNKL